jgi:DNA-binding PadR family transcriptional regulator
MSPDDMSSRDTKVKTMNGEIHLPLHEATTLILLSLAGGPRHGYAILKEVEHLSEGRVRLSTGTLYGALTRLLDQGLISRQEKEGAIGGRTKKQYELTPLGTQVLHAVARRLEHLANAARLRLSGGAI